MTRYFAALAHERLVVLMNVSGADPHATLRVYEERVLPELQA